MQGNIWFESPGLGQGSSFFVELPVYGRDAVLGNKNNEPLLRGTEIDHKPSNVAPLEVRQRNHSSSMRIVARKPSVRERLIARNLSIRIGITDSLDSSEKQEDEEMAEPPSSSRGRTPTAWIQPKVDSDIFFPQESNSIASFNGRK